jgi:hypothetical protein
VHTDWKSSEQVRNPAMPTVEIRDCGCDKTTNHINLEKISALLYCVECGGFHTGFEADIDGLIKILEQLRETRVYGQVARVAGEPTGTVIMTHREGESG